MASIKEKMEGIIYDDGKSPFLSFRFFLLLLSYLYRSIVSLRRSLFEKGILKSVKPAIPVISIGNITAGGTGKTPFTVYVADLLKRNGKKPAVISRGYGGNFEKDGGVVHDGNKIVANVEDAGDEPYLIAEKLKDVPVYVGSSRIKSAELAVKEGADYIVLDDGFQHIKLKRDIEIVLLDSAKPFGNGHLIPRGSLRDPLKYLKKADICILTRSENIDNRDFVKEFVSSEVFRTLHNAEITDISGNKVDAEKIKGKKIFAFSAIAHNEKFRKSAEENGLDIGEYLEFSDHHSYSKADMERIIGMSKEFDYLVTTEKDFVKIRNMGNWDNLLLVSISIGFVDNGFNECLTSKAGL